MAIIPRGAGGSGGGSSVTISTATPQPLGTAAAGSTGEASDAGHVHEAPAPSSDITTTTYAFDDATGVTLEDGSVGGTAAVAGGLLVLTCPATPAARHFSGYQEAPRGVIAVPAADGRAPVRWRVRARLASIDAGATAYLNISTAAGAARYGFYLNPSGAYGAEDNVTIGSYATGTGFPVDGTGWFEIEYDGRRVYFRTGTGVGAAEPSAWTYFARADIGAPRPIQVRLVGAANIAPGSAVTVEWDDCTFEALP